MKTSKNNVNDLLAAIQRKTPSNPSPAAIEPEVATEPESSASKGEPSKLKLHGRASAKKAIKSKVGKPVQFWMHDEDRKLVRELSAWLAGQGVRPSDSMVIRAALRFAKTGSAFLESYWEASQLDGRLKRN